MIFSMFILVCFLLLPGTGSGGAITGRRPWAACARTAPPLPRAAKKGGPLFEGINEGGPNKREERPLS